MAVGQEVNNLESSVVLQELQFAINHALYSLLWSLSSQYNVVSFPWPSLTLTENSVAERLIINHDPLFNQGLYS